MLIYQEKDHYKDYLLANLVGREFPLPHQSQSAWFIPVIWESTVVLFTLSIWRNNMSECSADNTIFSYLAIPSKWNGVMLCRVERCNTVCELSSRCQNCQRRFHSGLHTNRMSCKLFPITNACGQTLALKSSSSWFASSVVFGFTQILFLLLLERINATTCSA